MGRLRSSHSSYAKDRMAHAAIKLWTAYLARSMYVHSLGSLSYRISARLSKHKGRTD